jgi:hypothetical protein
MFLKTLSTSSVMLALLVAAAPAWAVIELFTEGGYEFDIQDTYSGNVSDGTSDAYDGCYSLNINDTSYTAGGVAGVLDGRHVTLATVTLDTHFEVTRYAYVPETGGDYIRYYDLIENTSGSAETLNVRYECNFGSDSSTTVWGTHSGDTTVDIDDYWFGTDDSDGSGDPSLAHAYFGDGAIYTPDSQAIGSGDSDVTFSLTLGPGEQVGFLVFGFQGPNQADVRTQVEALVFDLGPHTADMDGGQLATIVNWGLSGAPLIRWAPDQVFEVVEGGEVEISTSIEDREGDAYTVEWDLDGDGAFDDGSEETVTVSAAGLDGPDTITISIRATDTDSNTSERHIDIDILNAPPVLSSPTEVEVLINEEITYTPTVEDPGGDTVEIEVLDRPAGMVLLSEGAVRWTPREDDVGDHALTFRATDDDDDPDVVGDGDAELVVTITVVANQAPTDPPVLISPERSAEVTEARPTFVVENPTDPEGDAIYISFEVDETDTFTNPIASGPQNAGTDGTTSWTITEDLESGRYYWRACASDENSAEGPCSFSHFRVVLDDAGDGGIDGGPDQDAGDDTPRVEAGCGCSAAQNPVSSVTAVALIFFSVMALIRIRHS